ncbi:MAG: hypothetical protein IMF11_21340 [Proteobacteria bacterium]|nr:hypothetical protein [Pseudomonadota bacterium]
MDNLNIKVESVSDKTKAVLRADVAQTKEDIEAIEELFLETARKVARHSGDVAKDVLNDLADQSRKTTSVLGEKAKHVAGVVAERLKETGKDAAKASAKAAGKAAKITAEEVKKLGKRSLDVAKGGLSGLWKGAKDALKKEKEERS